MLLACWKHKYLFFPQLRGEEERKKGRFLNVSCRKGHDCMCHCGPTVTQVLFTDGNRTSEEFGRDTGLD